MTQVDYKEKMAQAEELLGRKSWVDALGTSDDMGPDERSFENLRTIHNAYGWTLDYDGRLHGLVNGDQGYAQTDIVIEADHVECWIQAKCDEAAIAKAGGFRKAAERRIGMSGHRHEDGVSWVWTTPLGNYMVHSDRWITPAGVSSTCENLNSGQKAAREHYVNLVLSCLRFEEGEL